MARLKSMANKLQTALALQGRYISINQTQIYSERLKKMCTKYTLKEWLSVKGKRTQVTLLETFKIVDVVTFLADEISGGE